MRGGEVTEREIGNQVVRVFPMVFRNSVGMIRVEGRTIKYGLHVGSGDYVGWQEIEITPDMIGKKIAVFASIEVKTLHDRLSDAQRSWFRAVQDAGGIAEIWKEEKNGNIRRITEL